MIEPRGYRATLVIDARRKWSDSPALPFTVPRLKGISAAPIATQG
jgi:hypothetical protein